MNYLKLKSNAFFALVSVPADWRDEVSISQIYIDDEKRVLTDREIETIQKGARKLLKSEAASGFNYEFNGREFLLSK